MLGPLSWRHPWCMSVSRQVPQLQALDGEFILVGQRGAAKGVAYAGVAIHEVGVQPDGEVPTSTNG